MTETSIVYQDAKDRSDHISIAKAEGALIWTRDGGRLIDFTSGWNVTNLGWNHPEIAEAIIAQTRKNAQSLLWGSDPIQEEYAAALTAALPKELDACIKATGGTEAVECAVKVVRAYTGRKRVIGFRYHYHGQLFASLALGLPENEHTPLAPLVPEITSVDFPDESVGEEGFQNFSAKLENVLSTEDVAAIVTEPGIVTGWGDTRLAYPGFLTTLRELTEKYGTLLVVDEVGTGFSRTGRLFAIEREGVVPDIVVFAKAISNGAAAIGTAVGRSDVLRSAFSGAALVSTFGWTPIACAAALETLRIHERERMWETAERKGEYVMRTLREAVGDKLVGVRGKGLEIGLQFRDEATCTAVQKSARAHGLHVIVGSREHMQIMPPLTIPQELLDEGLDILMKQVRV